MQLDDSRRRELFDALDGAIGPGPAATLMAHLPPAGWADLATKHDLHELEQRLDLRFDALDERFKAIDGRFDAIDERFKAIDERFNAVDRRFDSFMVGIDHRLEGMAHLVDGTCHRLAGELRQEMASMTRAFCLGVGAMTLTSVALAFGAARLGA